MVASPADLEGKDLARKYEKRELGLYDDARYALCSFAFVLCYTVRFSGSFALSILRRPSAPLVPLLLPPRNNITIS